MLKNPELKSGLFIITSLALLVFCILWLRYFAVSPAREIIIEFKDPGPVTSGMPVYYQGVNVGKVPEIGFSEDFKNIYVYVDIYNKKLKLPANIDAMIKTEGITGKRYINLTYPEQPVDELLASGDIIRGETPLGLDDLQEFIKENIENGRFQKIFNDMEDTIANANATTFQIGQTSEQINSLIETASIGVNEFNEMMENTNQVVKSIEDNQVIPRMTTAFDDASLAARRFDCVGKNTSQMLNQRYLLFKLMFGNPGKSLGQCGGIGESP